MKVLLVQPSLQPPGGGNGVAAWLIQALRPRHEVSTLTWQPIEVAEINRFFGTTLVPADVTPLPVPAALRRLATLRPLPLDLLRASVLQRFARRFAPRFEVLVSAFNEVDLGRRCIQYIHYPCYLRPRPAQDLRFYHLPPLLRLYYRGCDALAGFSFERMRQNLTLVNSDWTGERFREMYRAPCARLFPPVVGGSADVPWQEREDAFLCIGRIAPEKEIERVITILEAVRRHTPGVRLRLVGTGEDAYFRHIARLAEARSSWIALRLNVPRDELRRMLGSHRYGIHGMREEHFGMAVAEMVTSGCIVFVPDGGGQVEIVGGEPALVYRSVEEAAAKIARVLADPAEQSRLRARLAARRALFSTERFVREAREVVEAFGRELGAAAPEPTVGATV